MNVGHDLGIAVHLVEQLRAPRQRDDFHRHLLSGSAGAAHRAQQHLGDVDHDHIRARRPLRLPIAHRVAQ